MKGRIFNIQRFCVHDGPGIRTAVFFKGCPLNCAWCHNQESQRARAEILFSPEKCIGCGACVQACPKRLHTFDNAEHRYDRATCDACGACAGVCPAGALEVCGRETDTGEILAQVLRDTEFYRSSGGGITLSGGEPMAQSAFALELAQASRAAGLHVCLETCGCCPRAELERILPYVDLFLYDFKLADGEAHRRYTGADNALILENLKFLSRVGAKIILRCPVIPDVNFTDEHFEAIARTVKEKPGILQIDLEPYHPLGIDKARRLGRTAAYAGQDPPDPDRLQRYGKWLEKVTGIPVSV